MPPRSLPRSIGRPDRLPPRLFPSVVSVAPEDRAPREAGMLAEAGMLLEAGIPAGGVPGLVVRELKTVTDDRPHLPEVDGPIAGNQLDE